MRTAELGQLSVALTETSRTRGVRSASIVELAEFVEVGELRQNTEAFATRVANGLRRDAAELSTFDK